MVNEHVIELENAIRALGDYSRELGEHSRAQRRAKVEARHRGER